MTLQLPCRSQFSVPAALALFTTLALASPGARADTRGASRQPPPAAQPGPSAVRYQDLHWVKVLPNLGDGSPDLAIAHVDPRTQATQLFIRLPARFHVRPHFHSASESITVVHGSFIIDHSDHSDHAGQRTELGPGGSTFMPAKMVHEAWSGPGGDTLLSINTDGRWDLSWTAGPPDASDVNVNLPPSPEAPAH